MMWTEETLKTPTGRQMQDRCRTDAGHARDGGIQRTVPARFHAQWFHWTVGLKRNNEKQGETDFPNCLFYS